MTPHRNRRPRYRSQPDDAVCYLVLLLAALVVMAAPVAILAWRAL